MSIILLILVGVTFLGVSYAVQDILAKRKEQRALRKRLGPEYDEYLKQRKGKR